MAVLVLLDQRLESICLVPALFDDEYVVNPYVVEPHSKTISSVEGHMFGPHLVKVRCVTKSSDEGHMLGPHLVKVHCVTKSSNEGHILGYIWLKSAAWQSPPMRGTIWATFGQNPLCNKVLQWGAQFGPHLAIVRCVTKSSDEAHNFGHIWSKSAAWQSPPMRGTIWATFGQSPQWDKVLWWGAAFFVFATFGHCPLHDNFAQWLIMDIILWPHFTKVRCVKNLQTNEMCFSFYVRFGQRQLIDMHLSLVIFQFFECL